MHTCTHNFSGSKLSTELENYVLQTISNVNGTHGLGLQSVQNSSTDLKVQSRLIEVVLQQITSFWTQIFFYNFTLYLSYLLPCLHSYSTEHKYVVVIFFPVVSTLQTQMNRIRCVNSRKLLTSSKTIF